MAGAASGPGASGEGGGGFGGTGGATQCASQEDCATPTDDDCDGVINQGCAPTGYAFDKRTLDGGNLGDEPHNLAASGDAANYDSFATFALGQLLDKMKGVDGVADNLGNGDGYEWVCWTDPTDAIVFDFLVTRDIEKVTIGLSNTGLYVFEPEAVSVSFGDQPTEFGPPKIFSIAGGTLPQIDLGKRGDLTLAAPGSGRYVKVELTQSLQGGASCVDEIALE
jgi:hypothetical protein